MAVLDAPEQEHASEKARQPRGSAAPKRTMRREFTEFEDEQDELDDDGRRSARRRQGGVRVRVRGGHAAVSGWQDWRPCRSFGLDGVVRRGRDGRADGNSAR